MRNHKGNWKKIILKWIKITNTTYGNLWDTAEVGRSKLLPQETFLKEEKNYKIKSKRKKKIKPKVDKSKEIITVNVKKKWRPKELEQYIFFMD